MFGNDPDVLAAISTPWRFLIVMLPIAGVVFALDGVLLGAGDEAFLRDRDAGCSPGRLCR